MNVVQVKETMWKGSQSVNYECIVNVESDTNDSDTLRVNISRDSYDHQSHWRVEAWRQNGWAFITFLPIEYAKSSKVSLYGSDYGGDEDLYLDLFREDRDRLLEFACAVVF